MLVSMTKIQHGDEHRRFPFDEGVFILQIITESKHQLANDSSTSKHNNAPYCSTSFYLKVDHPIQAAKETRQFCFIKSCPYIKYVLHYRHLCDYIYLRLVLVIL